MLQSPVNLRYYQDDAVNVFTVGGCKNGIIVCPTGAGKSIVISELAKRLNDKNVLVLQPSKEILEQNFTKYSAYSNDASIYSASLNKKELNRVTFATIGSVIKLPNSILREFKVIVVDECHLVGQYGQYAELINIIKPDILIGLTATPYRNNSKFGGIKYEMLTRKIDCIFETIAYKYEIQDCIKDGFWCNIKYFTPIKYDTKNLETRGSEFKDEAVAQYNFSINLHENIIGIVNNSNKKHFLVFLTTIAECEHTEKILIQAGISCRAIHSKLHKKERDDILNKFKSGEIKVVLNVGVLTCLSEDTEILTQNGWKGMHNIQMNDMIAQYDQSNKEITFDMPIDIIKHNKYKGDSMINLNGRYTSFSVTDDHDMLIAKPKRGNCITALMKVKASDIVDKRCYIPVSGYANPLVIKVTQDISPNKSRFIATNSYNYRKKGLSKQDAKNLAIKTLERKLELRYKNPNELSLDECKLIGFWLGDGTKGKNNGGGMRYSISQSCRTPKMIEWIENILQSCNIHYNKHIYDKPKNNIILGKKCNILGHVVFNLAIGTGGNNQSYNGIYKILPYLIKNGTDLYWGLDQNQYIALIEGLWKADGWHGNNRVFDGGKIISESKDLFDLLQSIGVCRGFRVTVKPVKLRKHNKKQLYNLSLHKKTLHEMVNNKPMKHTLTDGVNVWCVQMPKSNIITRHNGCVTVMGNCGFDFPELDCLILARPTMSLSLYYQMLGRGVRTHKGKECCDIYDLCGNVESFGRIETLQFIGDNYKRLGLISDKRVLIAPPKSYMNAKMMKAEKFEDIGLVVLQNGKYAGTTIQEVWDTNKGYIQFCIDNNTSFKPIFEKFLLQQQKIAQLLR